MPGCEALRQLLEKALLPELEEAIDELFERIVNAKNADGEMKEEYAQFQELRTALNELLNDLLAGEVDEEECRELYEELRDMSDGEERDV